MIYLDHHSTTPLDPQVFEAMKPYFFEKFGNASHGVHRFNWEAEAAVTLARARVAECIGAHESEVVFTSSATESNHLAILGLIPELKKQGKLTVVSSQIEHASVLGPLQILEEQGFRVIWAPLHRDGRVDLVALEQILKHEPQVGLVSLAYANHEIGTIQDVRSIAELAHAAGAVFHCDAVQALGKCWVHVENDGVDLMTLSAHKIHGPKGVGALYIRRKKPRVILHSLMRGGSQERGLRPGTPNTPAIVGMGKAAQLVMQNREQEIKLYQEMRDQLWLELHRRLPCLIRNGSSTHGLPNNLSISVVGVDGAALFSRLKGVAVSNASACLNGPQDFSQVLTVLGVTESLARATLRFGIGRFNQIDEMTAVAEEIATVVLGLRQMEKEFAAQAGVELTKDGDCYS